MPSAVHSETDDGASHVNEQGHDAGRNLRKSRNPKAAVKESRLDELRRLREEGKKKKHEVEEAKPVYDYVTEEEYEKIVQKRQEENWIELSATDDADYYDDGREIFDDEEEDRKRDKKNKNDRKTKNGAKEARGEEERPDICSPDIRNFMIAGPSGKPKSKGLAPLTKGKEILLDDLLDELQGCVPEPKQPNRLQLFYGDKAPSFALARLQKNQQKPSTDTNKSPFQFNQPDSVQKDQSDASVLPPDMGLEPQSPVLFPTSQEHPTERTKRPVSESPKKPEETEVVALKPKITAFAMDRPLKNSSNNGSAKKTKPNTPVKKQSFESDWSGDLDFTEDLEISLNLAENVGAASGHTDSHQSEKLNRMPVLTKQFEASRDINSAPQMVVDFDEYLHDENSSDGARKFYWLDAFEDVHHEGCVFLFGVFMDKINSSDGTHRSCVKIEGIQRRLYFCLREGAEIADLKAEVAEIMRSKGKTDNYREKEVDKSYAFDKVEIPSNVRCLEVRYSFKDPILPENIATENISHVFGRNTSALEIFLLDRKLRGPCWLNVNALKPQQHKISLCKHEFIVEKPSLVSIIPDTKDKAKVPAPLVTIMALQLRVVVDSRTKQNEIVAAALLWRKDFPLDNTVKGELYSDHLMLLAPTVDTPFPCSFNEMESVADIWKQRNALKVEVCRNERQLLSSVFTRMQQIDPDFLIFHDALGYQLDVLLHRATRLGVPNWSRLGRLQRKVMPQGRHAVQAVTAGRLIVDIRRSAEELIHCKSYDLNELVWEELKETRNDLDSDLIKEMYRSLDNLKLLVDLTLTDVLYILRIMCKLDAIPLALQITKIAGNILSRTFLGGRSERNEFLLLHAFTEKNFICPDKEWKAPPKKQSKKGKEQQSQSTEEKEVKEEPHREDEVEEPETVHADAPTTGGKRKPAYAGGLVLEPKKGLHDHFILLMDFNSLYPSIIQEYNICFTTVDRAILSEENADVIPELPDKPGKEENSNRGVLPAEIYRLVEDRKAVKSQIKSETEKNPQSDRLKQLEIRQKALKLTANSMYGCLGFASSRFFARPLAALITSQGREILKNTKELVEKQGLEVIYGDTDSIMINTHLDEYDKVLEKGNEVKHKVGRQYKCLELGIDGIFRKLLLLQKKKYAALVVKREKNTLKYDRELKGLDIVRRDWSELARKAGSEVVEQILAIQDMPTMLGEIQAILQKYNTRVTNFQMTDVELYVITKQLTKDPLKYADSKGQPHVQVAVRWNESGRNAKKLGAGDVVPFVICNEPPPKVAAVASGQKIPHTQRAYHVEELLASNGALTIDKQYYLAEQVHKVVNRLCEFVEGLDSATIAQLLGVDRSQFPQFFVVRVDEDDAAGAVPDSELYRNCQPLQILCPKCSERWEMAEPVYEKDGQFFLSLAKCSACDVVPMNYILRIRNLLTLEINRNIQRYYEVNFVCEDADCHFMCNFMPPKFHRSRPICPVCNKSGMKADFTERDLYLQLGYWRNAFDPSRTIEKIKNQAVKDKLKNDLLKFNAGQLAKIYDDLAGVIKMYMDRSAYAEVRFDTFFLRNEFTKLNLGQRFKDI
ncbi:DNA polymerase alpha catalytic subunit-like [Paramacrobiotus metropolitanus]|uniref:DNA polymerase alpha catalytic subunit-like n=1 Tax=Paramacrobiotus metropolitanus TaxID=2943436 RepID=UPI0024458552|nr:DNA polymerase alpha catalytic subunit-like [Paramacrobiotus metropolitanus]